MATGIFALLDDIALLADDAALASKTATQKTAGILGDDLAVNAEKATGFEQHRELKVIWAITKGSLVNKAIILPAAFLLSAFVPWLIPYILILGGLYLLYEGAEKIEEFLTRKDAVAQPHKQQVLTATEENILEVEKQKIKAALMTDFILSIEIVMIALGTVLEQPLGVQIAATTFVALVATFGVYGLVALIVRIDNVGFWCLAKKRETCGNFLISLMPKLIKTLSVIGTVAMVLVGGGILAHNVDFIHHYFIDALPGLVNELLVGVAVGAVMIAGLRIYHGLKGH